MNVYTECAIAGPWTGRWGSIYVVKVGQNRLLRPGNRVLRIAQASQVSFMAIGNLYLFFASFGLGSHWKFLEVDGGTFPFPFQDWLYPLQTWNFGVLLAERYVNGSLVWTDKFTKHAAREPEVGEEEKCGQDCHPSAGSGKRASTLDTGDALAL